MLFRYLCLSFFPLLAASSALGEPRSLPFDPEAFSRLSVEDRPRSLALRQGQGIWLAYDLEQAVVFQCWQAPEGKPGLLKRDFTTRSSGKTLCVVETPVVWQWMSGQVAEPCSVRYLGCADRADHVELRWELRGGGVRTLQICERVARAGAQAARVVREIQVKGLRPKEKLLIPGLGADAWHLSTFTGEPAHAITDEAWHQLSLP